ncbi:hypothetical protein SLEP1_g26775 [Rubroshorea leprosula]|uniref:Uncharacterized protein n=1 Tax=Rubroshorea leprosula TaxID=152421 RepID=A0AAV5JTN4_9ROSI|nr:hypothetical protein SLEP1_g26775 [Rubroshorea leprosula]
MKQINGRMKQLKAEMEEISKEQESIRHGQKEVREKFEAIETECQQLRRDTQIMAQQSASTKLRLVIMFQILRARENNDFATATDLTRILREMIARNSQT